MGLSRLNVGQELTLASKLKKILAGTTVAVAIASGAFFSSGHVVAGGETRTLSLYQVHTKENLTITYMKDGNYIPSAMKKINYFMRDWRRDEVVKIDPKTVDLMWELHADLGSKAPIHIICGYRSGKTNAFLKRIGRNVAKHSQHSKGKAIDFYFPDVKTVKIRNSALVRKIGGVGYYRSSGGPSGFVHVDTGKIRHWGPHISKSQMASIVREGKKTIGRRVTNGGSAFSEVASAEPAKKGLMATLFGGSKKTKPTPPPVAPVETITAKAPVPANADTNYEGYDEELSDLSEDIANSAVRPKLKTVPPSAPEVADPTMMQTASAISDPTGISKGYPVPRPRLKPIEIMMEAAANMDVVIEPVNAPPEGVIRKGSNDVEDGSTLVSARNISTEEPETLDDQRLIEELEATQVSVLEGKGDFGGRLSLAKPRQPTMVIGAVGGDDELWNRLVQNNEEQLQGAEPEEIEQQAADGKGDLQVVNREGKGAMLRPLFRLSKATN